MISFFNNAISFTEDEIPSDDIIDTCFPIYICVKLLGEIVKHAFIDGGVGLNICSIDFLKNFGDKLIPNFL